MGWSCSCKASNRLQAIQEWCVNHGGTGSSNTWNDPRTGEQFFFETSRREHRDGAITGSVMKSLPNDKCTKTGSFKIASDGREFRGPAILKAVPAYEIVIDSYPAYWSVERNGLPDDKTLWNYLLRQVKSYEKGGVNQLISKSMGKIPYPHHAHVIDLTTGKIVVQWDAPMFQIWDTSTV